MIGGIEALGIAFVGIKAATIATTSAAENDLPAEVTIAGVEFVRIPAGPFLYTVETDSASGQAWISVRDVRTLARVAQSDEVPRWTPLQWATVTGSAAVHVVYFLTLLRGGSTFLK